MIIKVILSPKFLFIVPTGIVGIVHYSRITCAKVHEVYLLLKISPQGFMLQALENTALNPNYFVLQLHTALIFKRILVLKSFIQAKFMNNRQLFFCLFGDIFKQTLNKFTTLLSKSIKHYQQV